jgi:hypothetical protein
MEITDSSLWREVEAVIQTEEKPVHYNWTAEIHVGDDETYTVLKVMEIDFKSDYETQFADEIIVKVALSPGTYAKKIYPRQDEVDITLTRDPLLEYYNAANDEQDIQSERYTATVVDTGNPVLEGSVVNDVTEEALNLQDIIYVTFQLVGKALEQLRMITVGGIWRNCTVQEAVTTILTQESQKVEVDDIVMPQGVDMVDAANTTKRDHVIIPQGTRLVDVPAYIHHKCGGIYRTGLGYYLQQDWWYVYPCFDTTRFEDAEETLTVVNVPKNRLPGVERTYRKDGNTLVVIATGDIKFRDDSEVQQLNMGNGVRFADADKFMGDFAETKDNKTRVKRGTNNSEFVSLQRKNGNNNAQLSPRAITANPYVEYSQLARREGGVVVFEWQNSAPELLFPGMMVKLLYLEDEEVMEVYGVLLKAHHYVHNLGQGMTEIRYRSSSAISVFLKPLTPGTDPQEQ